MLQAQEVATLTQSTTATIRLHSIDNIEIALRDLVRGYFINEQNAQALANIDRGHNVATNAIKRGENIYRYGQIIGQATRDIRRASTCTSVICA